MRIVAVGLGLLFAGIGSGLLVVAAQFINADRAIAGAGRQAQGIVVDIVGARGYRGRIAYQPIVSFTDHTGQQRYFTSQVSSNPPAYEKGESVAVLYDPARPDKAMIDSFIDRHLGSLIFGVMGTIFAVLGAGALIGLVRQR